MRTWLEFAVTTVLLGASVAACSSTEPDKYPGSDSMCADIAKNECQIASICGVPRDVCEQARKTKCQVELVGPAVSAGRTYTASLAPACVDKTTEIYSADKRVITAAALAQQVDVCNRVFAGNAASGSACTNNYSCKGSAICTNKFCGDKTERAAGAGCANPGDVCAAGNFCDRSGVAAGMPALCKAGKAAGESCTATGPGEASQCGANLRCSIVTVAPPAATDAGAGEAAAVDAGAATGGTGVCVATLQAGGTCADDSDCSTTAPYCDKASGNSCSAGLTFANKSATCKPYGGT